MEVDGRTYLQSATSTYGASGLAGVWAEENTREAIYDAFRRKETFATSGTRIRLRFFAGHELDAQLLDDPAALNQAYGSGVSMGGDLEARADLAPQFVLWALADPKGAPLQRLQIIKGWMRDGESMEQVYDVGCSEGEPDPETHRCGDNGGDSFAKIF